MILAHRSIPQPNVEFEGSRVHAFQDHFKGTLGSCLFLGYRHKAEL